MAPASFSVRIPGASGGSLRRIARVSSGRVAGLLQFGKDHQALGSRADVIRRITGDERQASVLAGTNDRKIIGLDHLLAGDLKVKVLPLRWMRIESPFCNS